MHCCIEALTYLKSAFLPEVGILAALQGLTNPDGSTKTECGIHNRPT